METEKKKLTDTQLRIVQGVAAVLAAAALMVTISLSNSLGGILQYSFLVVFVIVIFGRRWVETKFRLRLNFFNLVLIVSIMVGIFIYLVLAFYSPGSEIQLSDTLKTLMLVGVALLTLVLGIALPLRLYFKRKEKGTLVPIRLPEKTEEEEKQPVNCGPKSIAQQIEEMTRELDGKNDEKK